MTQDILKHIKSGDLIYHKGQGYYEIGNIWFDSDIWFIELKDYTDIMYFYRIKDNKWYYFFFCYKEEIIAKRNGDYSIVFPDTRKGYYWRNTHCFDKITIYQKMDTTISRDIRLNELIS